MNDVANTRPNPYVGPRAFKFGETLFGRDREKQELLDLLIAERIVLMYSPSGAGKTSLIQAALIPSLEKENFRIIPRVQEGETFSPRLLRVNQLPPPGSSLPPETNRYILSLLLLLEEALPQEKQMSVKELAGMHLSEYLKQRTAMGKEEESLAIIVDQFEEILSLDPTDREAKAEFFNQLGEALRNKGLWALFAMREEYLAGLEPYLRPIPSRFSTTFRLDLLGEHDAKRAMQKPAEAANVTFTDDATKKLVDDLRNMQIQRPDGSMEDRPGPFVEPVQLQVVCHRLWEMLSPTDMEIGENEVKSLGNVNIALSDYYAEQVASVATETGVSERTIRDWFENQLITAQGIRGQV
ncbi:ATP-binding protein, partial [bacterium]|nr:ATP-binding protein [bacterium]